MGGEVVLELLFGLWVCGMNDERSPQRRGKVPTIVKVVVVQ